MPSSRGNAGTGAWDSPDSPRRQSAYRVVPKMRRSRQVAHVAMAALAVLLTTLLFASASAAASSSATEMLREVRSGARSCSSLSGSEFERIGEFAMQRMVGSARAHESMDALMGEMLGSSWDRRMHVALGQRASGCGGALPARFGAMMGAIGMMAGRGARDYGPGMMGEGGYGYHGEAAGDRGYGRGSMMGDRFGDSGGGAPGWLVAVLAAMVAVLGGGLVWLLAKGRRGPPEGSALQILQNRYAAGEIDSEEYERRRSALGGGA
jgi:uncharacterized membrane protein